MVEQPSVNVLHGSPTPLEEEAVRAAIETIWLEERAKAAAAELPSGWVMAARAESTGRGLATLRGGKAWRFSSRFLGNPPTPTQTGRGDAK
jgi:hypothetical protein